MVVDDAVDETDSDNNLLDQDGEVQAIGVVDSVAVERPWGWVTVNRMDEAHPVLFQLDSTGALVAVAASDRRDSY